MYLHADECLVTLNFIPFRSTRPFVACLYLQDEKIALELKVDFSWRDLDSFYLCENDLVLYLFISKRKLAFYGILIFQGLFSIIKQLKLLETDEVEGQKCFSSY